MIPGAKRKEVSIHVQADAKDRRVGRAVLIADEAFPIRKKLEEILRRQPVPPEEIRVAVDAAEAMAAFREMRPHLVLTELMGEDTDAGLDMIHEMLDVDPDIKIIVVTAERDDSPTVRAAVRAGVFAVIRKPLRHEKIRAALAEVDAEEGGIERLR